MSSMTTLEKVYDRVESMARFHEDRLIPVDDVSFADLERVCISGATYNLRPIAQQSICYRLGIPIHYLRKCPVDIQQNNLNYWIKHEKNEKLFFRFDQGEVRAIFTPRYVPTDNKEVLDRLLEHGDFGIGTVEGIDGEMMVLDGVAYRAGTDLAPETVPAGTLIPFAMLTYFDETVSYQLSEELNYTTFKDRLDDVLQVQRLVVGPGAPREVELHLGEPPLA